MIRIVSAKALPGYKLELEFTDGCKGIADVSHLVGKGVFSAWNDVSLFNQVFVGKITRTVEWPNGLDLDPDVLYERAIGKREVIANREV